MLTDDIVGASLPPCKESDQFVKVTRAELRLLSASKLSKNHLVLLLACRFFGWSEESLEELSGLPDPHIRRLKKQLEKYGMLDKEAPPSRVRATRDPARVITRDPARARPVQNSPEVDQSRSNSTSVRAFCASDLSRAHARTHEGKISIEVRSHYRQLFPEVTASKITKILEAGALACEQEIGSAPTHDEWIAFGTWAKNAACLNKATYRLGASMAHLAGRVARMRSVNKTSGNSNAPRSGSLLPTLAQSERAAELVRLLASR